jgi:redox-sensitive bicupin YhaK (pirin superfamily)
MLKLCRAGERLPNHRRRRETWCTFDPGGAGGFGTLECLNEDRLPPGAGVPPISHRDAEVVTYVREGSLAYQDATGRSGVMQAGEFQRWATGQGNHHSEANASRTHWTQVFRLWLSPSEAVLVPDVEQRRFGTAERRGVYRLVASPDARRGSLRLHQDVLVFSSILGPGLHLVHELAEGRTAWLHVVHGEVSLGDVILTTGDGAGFAGERAVSLTAREDSELLLVDLGGDRGHVAGA